MSGGRGLWSGSHTNPDSPGFRTLTDCDRAAGKRGKRPAEAVGNEKARQGNARVCDRVCDRIWTRAWSRLTAQGAGFVLLAGCGVCTL